MRILASYLDCFKIAFSRTFQFQQRETKAIFYQHNVAEQYKILPGSSRHQNSLKMILMKQDILQPQLPAHNLSDSEMIWGEKNNSISDKTAFNNYKSTYSLVVSNDKVHLKN